MALLTIVQTSYHGPTDNNGPRISARFTDRFTGQRHRITRARDYDVEPNEHRTQVARELIEKHYPGAQLVGNQGDTYAFLIEVYD